MKLENGTLVVLEEGTEMNMESAMGCCVVTFVVLNFW
jgi:hypothetical protein